MTSPDRGATATQDRAATRASSPYSDPAGDAYIRRSGRGFIISLYAALRAIRLYPLENAAVQNAVEDLAQVAGALVEHERELEKRGCGEFVFVNTVRLRLDLDNYASFSQMLSLFRSSGIGSLHLQSRPQVKEWQRFLALVLVPSQDPPATRFHQLTGKLEQQGLTMFELGEVLDNVSGSDTTFQRNGAPSFCSSNSVNTCVPNGRSGVSTFMGTSNSGVER